MRNKIWENMCCLAAASLLFGMAGCKVNELNTREKEPDNGPTVIVISAKSEGPEESSSTSLPESGIINGWFCVFEDGAGEMMRQTYVYELSDGRYRFINVQSVTASWGSSKWKHVVKGTGTVDSREAIVEEAKKFQSCGFIMYAGDTVKKPHSVAEFLAKKPV